MPSVSSLDSEVWQTGKVARHADTQFSRGSTPTTDLHKSLAVVAGTEVGGSFVFTSASSSKCYKYNSLNAFCSRNSWDNVINLE